MLRTPLFAALAVASATACVDRLPVTPPSTTLFEWDLTKATRAPIRAATIGARKVLDKKLTVNDGGAPFVVDVHIENAEVDFEEAGKKVHQVAPVLLRAKVSSNDKWQLSGKCSDGPNYKMPSVGPGGEFVTPLGMVEDCTIRYHRNDGLLFKSTYELGVMLQIYADGTISLPPGDRFKLE